MSSLPFYYKQITFRLDRQKNQCNLGLWFNEHLDMKFDGNELAKSTSRALFSALYTKYLNVGGMDYDVFCKVYESLVEPVLLYDAGSWGLSKHSTE